MLRIYHMRVYQSSFYVFRMRNINKANWPNESNKRMNEDRRWKKRANAQVTYNWSRVNWNFGWYTVNVMLNAARQFSIICLVFMIGIVWFCLCQFYLLQFRFDWVVFSILHDPRLKCFVNFRMKRIKRTSEQMKKKENIGLRPKEIDKRWYNYYYWLCECL